MGAHMGLWAHELLGWGTTRRKLKVQSEIAARNRYFKKLRVLCLELRNSLTSEKGVQLITILSLVEAAGGRLHNGGWRTNTHG